MTTSSKMSHKVSPSAKISRPVGDLGDLPQRTAPNPSQRNGFNPPKIPLVQRDLGEPAPFHPDPRGVNR
jgi:hypothetical protein